MPSKHPSILTNNELIAQVDVAVRISTDSLSSLAAHLHHRGYHMDSTQVTTLKYNIEKHLYEYIDAVLERREVS